MLKDIPNKVSKCAHDRIHLGTAREVVFDSFKKFSRRANDGLVLRSLGNEVC